jgi:hypothetical protein
MILRKSSLPCTSKLCLFGREWRYCEYLQGHPEPHSSGSVTWTTAQQDEYLEYEGENEVAVYEAWWTWRQ